MPDFWHFFILAMSNFVIRKMTRPEMDVMISNALKEDWFESYDVLDAFATLDSDGFFVGEIDGKIIGHVSFVRYEENYGFVGYYIIIPEYRHQGYGLRLWREGIKHMEGCNIGLDAVAEEIPVYKKAGFKICFDSWRFVGVSKVMPMDSHIVKYDETLLDQICEYDRKCFPSRRREFLKAWLSVPHGHAVAYIEDGVIKGYGAMHRTTESNEISPCFGDDEHIAKAIYVALINCLGDDVPVHWNVPEDNPAAVKLIKELAEYQVKIRGTEPLTRMYTGDAPDIDSSKVWSLTSFSIG